MNKQVLKLGRTALLIAITIVCGSAALVILAAALGGFVLNNDIDNSKSFPVGMIVKTNPENGIIITNVGGQRVPDLKSLAVSYQPAGAARAINITNQSALDQLRLTNGSMVIGADGSTAGDTSDDLVYPVHVIVTGTFGDGDVIVIGECDVQSFY